MQVLSLIIQATYILLPQKMIFLQNIVLIQTMYQANKKTGKKKKKQTTSVIDHHTESENETLSAGEGFTHVSGVTVECNNLQSVSEITEFIFVRPK